MIRRRWTSKDIAELKNLTNRFWTDEQIAARLNRSINAISIKRNKLIGKFIKCEDCNKIVKVKRGRQIRCEDCAKIHNKIKRHENYKIWLESGGDKLKLIRDKSRFGGNRELAIKRDNEKCQNCGMTRQEHFNKWNCDITVDHIDGTGRNDKPTNNDLNNLITLCLSCHGKKDAKRRIQDWSMISEMMIKFHDEQKKIKAMSIIEKLNNGYRPHKTKNNHIIWK